MRHRLLRFSSSTALLFMPVVVHAQSKFEGSITMALGAPQGRTEVTYLVRGDRLRVDMPGGGGMAGYVVRDAGKNVTTMVMPSQRAYMDLSALQAMMPDAATQAAKTPDIKPTGKKETVAGVECEHVIVAANDGQYDVCGAKGLGSFSSMSSPMSRGTSGPPGLERLGKDFFPLKMQKVGGDVLMQVTKIEKKSLDASMFAVPEGYQKIEMLGHP
jgi:Domain of unknown function (DUF4412)